MAAPPATKFMTIAGVTSAGKAETPSATTPWSAAMTATSLVLEPGPRLGADAGELDGERLEPAQRPGRLGELRLARLGGAHRRPVERLDAGDGLGELVGHSWCSSSLAKRVGGERLDLERDAGDEQVDLVGGLGQAPVGAPELVAVETGDGVLGNDPQADLVGDGDHGRAGLAQGGEQVVEGAADARGDRLFDLARDERLVEVAEACGRRAAQVAGREHEVADPERDAVEQEDGSETAGARTDPAAGRRRRGGGGAAHRRRRLERALQRDPGGGPGGAMRGHASRHLLVVGLGGGEVGRRGRRRRARCKASRSANVLLPPRAPPSTRTSRVGCSGDETTAALPRGIHRSDSRTTVSWLAASPYWPRLPTPRGSGGVRRSSAVTVAGQRRSCTGFPRTGRTPPTLVDASGGVKRGRRSPRDRSAATALGGGQRYVAATALRGGQRYVAAGAAGEDRG